MRHLMFSGVLVLALISSSVVAAEARFTSKPSASQVGNKVKVSFAVSAPTDVAVAVLDAKGKVVRHLAAGVLGKNAPEPLKKNSLSQELFWNGKDDLGRAALSAGASGEAGFKVRVRLGLKATFDRIIGWSGHWLGELAGMVCGPDGTVYVVHEGDWLPHRHSWMINAYDRKGAYHHQVYPGPANLPAARRRGWPWLKLEDGGEIPVVHHLLSRSLYPGGLLHKRTFPVVTRDGRLILLSGAGKGLRADRPDIRGGRRLLILGTDGSVPATFLGPIVAPAEYGGFGHLALTPDEKQVYLSGLFVPPVKKGGKGEPGKSGPCNVIWKIALNSDAKPQVFVGRLFKAGTGKDRLDEPQGLAVDKAGNLYVADYGNNRVAVFRPDGTYLDEVEVPTPDLVKVSRRTGAFYVTSIRKRTRTLDDPHWYSHSHSWKLLRVLKFAGLGSKAPAASFGPSLEKGYGGGAYIALDDSGYRPILYVGGLEWRDSRFYRCQERDGRIELASSIAGYSVWKHTPAGNVGFTGDLAYADGFLFTSGPSSHGFKGNNWARYDAITGEFKGPWSALEADGTRGPASTHQELVGGKDGRLYIQEMTGTVSRYQVSGRPAAFPATGKHVLKGFLHGYSRQTGIFVTETGTLYVPCTAANRELDVLRIKKVSAEGEILDEKVVEIRGARVGGVAVDPQGRICVGAQVAPADAPLPAWVAGRLPKDIATEEAERAYRHVGSIVQFPASGGAIVDEGGGRYVGIVSQTAAPVAIRNNLWHRRVGLVSTHHAGCACESTRIDVDEYGRVYVPDTLRFSVVVFDRAGNLVTRFGSYGNMDSRGPGSPVPEPAIAFAWPLRVAVGRGKAFVVDPVNCRVVAAALEHVVAQTVPIASP